MPKPPCTQNKPYVTLPYVSDLSMVKTVSHQCDVNIAFKYTSTLRSILVRNKEFNNVTAGVYKIPCRDCNHVYIGETGRDLDTRIKEHKYACKVGNNNNAIFVHSYNNNHVIDWTSSQMLYNCSNFKKRRIVESVCIDKYENFNLSEGTFRLDPVIKGLVARSLPPKVLPSQVT